ncbi:hypothetical protein B0H13DRAFT_1885146 [Mycena leptocephala]|nr:hypothetical protein B0H13DRAFT_1885146 [Mycena leptocephala]
MALCTLSLPLLPRAKGLLRGPEEEDTLAWQLLHPPLPGDLVFDKRKNNGRSTRFAVDRIAGGHSHLLKDTGELLLDFSAGNARASVSPHVRAHAHTPLRALSTPEASPKRDCRQSALGHASTPKVAEGDLRPETKGSVQVGTHRERPAAPLLWRQRTTGRTFRVRGSPVRLNLELLGFVRYPCSEQAAAMCGKL